jgi:transposase
MARPTKYSPERQQAIVAALQAGNTRTAAAAQAGISLDTFERWMDRFAEFCGAIKKAEADAEIHFAEQIEKAATDGSWQAAAWWLERRRPEAWGRRDRVDFTIRKEAERLASELGLDAQQLVREAERIVAGRG